VYFEWGEAETSLTKLPGQMQSTVTPHSTTGIAPCELLLKHYLRTRLDLFQPTSIDVPKGKIRKTELCPFHVPVSKALSILLYSRNNISITSHT